MVNDIKIDGLSKTLTNLKPASREIPAIHAPIAAEGIIIGTQLGTLASTLSADNHMTERSQHITELKQKILNNQYAVDIDSLATSMTHSIITS